VFLAGAITHSVDAVDVQDVFVAAYDSRDASFVAAVNVNELTDDNGGTDEVDFRSDTDRVGVDADALNRVVVAWEMILPDTFLARQTVTRVLAFDEDSGTFSYLTPSFFPFQNFLNEDLNITPVRTSRPHVSMTTQAICVAAKGEINSENLPEDGADTPELNFYTVISHPVPLDDPTPPVTPTGGESALLKPGDVNFDGAVNISDPVSALSFLFAGQVLAECLAVDEGGEVTLTGAGLAVLDWNGDAVHNISDPVGSLNFQFGGGGSPHVLGSDCTMIAGDCVDNCVQ
jgi:hypothetical protein